MLSRENVLPPQSGKFVVHEIAISDSLIVDMVSIITLLFAIGSLSMKENRREAERRGRGEEGRESESENTGIRT